MPGDEYSQAWCNEMEREDEKRDAALDDYRSLQAECRRLRAEVDRLSEWLLKIEGGDNPCDDAETLRRWAYVAVTLGRPALEDT